MKHTRSYTDTRLQRCTGRTRLLRMTAVLLLCLMVAADMTPVFAADAPAFAKAGDAVRTSHGNSGQTDSGTQPGQEPSSKGGDSAVTPAQDGSGATPGDGSGGTPAEGGSDATSGDGSGDTPAEGGSDATPGDGSGGTPAEGGSDATSGDGSDGTPAEGDDPAVTPEDSWTPEDGLPGLKGVKVTALNDTQLLATWKAAEDFHGYQVEYARNILFIRKTSLTTEDGSLNNITLDGLNTAKRYYVRVRGYRIYEGENHYSEWTVVKTNNAASEATVKYATLNGSKVDVRKQAGSKLSQYSIAQGTCSDGTYLYMAFEKRNGDDNGSGKARIKIAKVRISDWKLMKVSASGQKLGHANDMTYNPDDNILVVTGAKTNDPYLRIVSPKTLKKTGTKKIRLKTSHKYVKAFNAIDYDPGTGTYYIRSRNYSGWTFTLNRNFKEIDSVAVGTVFPSRHVQSCTSLGNTFLISQSWYQSKTKNSVTIFDKAGKQLQHITLKLSGELESLFFIGDQLYATVHKHVSKSYKTCFIFRILL